MPLGHQQLPGFVAAHPGIRTVALKPLVGRGGTVLSPTYCMKDCALDTRRAIDERIITDGDAKIRNADSTVLKSVAAQPQASTAALLCAFQAGNFDLPSVRTDSTCVGLRRGGPRK
jgi:hypothetical protein